MNKNEEGFYNLPVDVPQQKNPKPFYLLTQ